MDVTGQVNGEERTGYGNGREKKQTNKKPPTAEGSKAGEVFFRMVTASHELGRKIHPAKG